MAGYLDKNTRVVDMVLTGYGRRLLSQGELRFVYWMPFDDEVDYDPFVSTSGSMTVFQLSSSRTDQMEATLVREAVNGHRIADRSGSNTTNVYRPIFTMPQGQMLVPRMTSSEGPTGSLDLGVSQRKLYDLSVRHDQHGNVIEQFGPYDRGVERFDASMGTLRYRYVPGSLPDDYRSEGFLVRVFRSGAEGPTEISPKVDSRNEISFNNDVILRVEDGADGD